MFKLFSLLLVMFLSYPLMGFGNLVFLLSILLFMSVLSLCGLNQTSLFTEVSGFSSSMISLTIFISIMMLMVGSVKKHHKIKYFSVLGLMVISLFFFMTDNFLFLYVFFEFSLVPTVFLVLKWGYQPERLEASFYFMMYTICASLPLLFMVLKIYKNLYTLNLGGVYPLLVCGPGFNNFLFFMSMILAFLVKLPSWGVHLWLPKAHVEAPVAGSMILAGVLLKLGGYGLMRVSSFTYSLSAGYINLSYSVGLWGSLYVSLVCLNSIDMKKMIAYSSVIHMNLLIVGILSKSMIGAFGGMMMMISHGVSSSGLFTLANENYKTVYSRNILFQKNIAKNQPFINLMWFILVSANMAAPPSLNLASELFIAISVLKVSFLSGLFLGLVTFLGGAYNLYLFSSQQGNNPLYQNPNLSLTSISYFYMLMQALPCYILVLFISILM